MRNLQSLGLLAAMLSFFLCASPANAQTPRPDATMNLAQAERVAGDLKQGMTVDEVQKLLGKPRRTALKSDGGLPGLPSKGSLQWTYNWTSASAQGNLRVDFLSKSPEEWYVNGWEWVAY
jgi:hypothetical protein